MPKQFCFTCHCYSVYLPYECETVIVGMEDVEAQVKLQTKELQITIKPNPAQAMAVAAFETPLV